MKYIKSIPLRPNRYRLPDGELTPAQERGQAIFNRTSEEGWHANSAMTVNVSCATPASTIPITTSADVGTGKTSDRSPRWTCRS